MPAEKQRKPLAKNEKPVFSDSPRLPSLAGYRPQWVGTRWRGVSLEYHHHPPSETPEYALDHYVISLNVGRSFQLEMFCRGRKRTAWLVTGMVGLCPRHVPHAIRWNQEVSVLLINFAPALVARHAVALGETNGAELAPFPAVHDPLIYQIGLALEADLKACGRGDRLYGETLVMALIARLLKQFPTQKDNAHVYVGGLSPLKLRLVRDYIHDYLLERELSLDELATLTRLSPYYFCRAFKQSTGLSPHQYVIQKRVEQAKRLLSEGKMLLCEVAVACGFTDQSHLCRCFKRMLGVTPKAFSKLSQERSKTA